MGRLGTLEWWEHAACLGAPTTLFIQPVTIRKQNWAEEALQYCQGCPVTEQCLQEAIETGDTVSVRGGTTPKERKHA